MVESPIREVNGTAALSSDTLLLQRVGLESLQRLQDHFAMLGKVTVCICTVEGDPITVPTWGSRFSQLIGSSARGRALLIQALRERARCPDNKVTIECHDGMTLYGSPIEHDGALLGTLTVGTRAGGPPTPEAVARIAEAYGISTRDLLRFTGEIDPYSGGAPEAIHRFADVLADTIATLYGQADRIERQLADLRTVHGLAELLTGTRDLQQMLDKTVRRVVEVMPVKACAIRLLNPDTGELSIKAVHNLSAEYLSKGPVMLDSGTIDALAFAGQTVYSPDVPRDPRTRYPENARKEGLVSGLCVPLAYRGETIGAIRVYTEKHYEFTESEVALLRSIGAQAAAAIITTRLWKEQAEAEQFQRQVEAAAEIQRRMLPRGVPKRRGLELGCVYDPTLQLGGDFYDFIDFEKDRLGVCVADVVGKGLPAALMMASVRSALRVHAHRRLSVSAVVAEVNRHMSRDTSVSEFATLFYGVLSSDGHELVYCNAGHIPPLLLRDGVFTELSCGGLVIGVNPHEDYERGRVLLKCDDILVMVTDGVTEAMNFEGQAFGHERLRKSILAYEALDAHQMAKQLLWDVRRFAGLAEQSDDITIVVAKVC